MRSLWPVMGVCVLVAACGRPNPGFGLIDSGDPAGSDGQSGSGSTGTSSVSSAPTSTEASTLTTGVVTGSEGTTDPVDPTSTTASGSTDETGATTKASGFWEFPTDCGAQFLVTEFTDAAADTFFLNEFAATECSFLMGGDLDPNCRDLQFSESDVFQLFLQSDLNNQKLDDYVGIYAVRFATPTPLHEGIPIPEDKFLGVEARIHLFRPFPKNTWSALKFHVRRFTEDDTWMTTEGYDYTPCHASATSYRCRVCALEGQPVDSACAVEWGGKEAKHKGLPYDPAMPPIQTLNVPDEPNLETGQTLLLNVFTKEDLAWLTTEGLMLMPGIETKYASIEVKTLESGKPEWHPGLRVRYCEPIFVEE